MSIIYYFVNSVNVSDSVLSQSFTVSKVLSTHGSSASFTMENPTTIPLEGNDVKVYLDTTVDSPRMGSDASMKTYLDANATVLFGGVIYSISQSKLVPGYWKYQVQCTDYTRLLDRRLVAETYLASTVTWMTTLTSKEIMEDILTKYTSGFDSSGLSWANFLLGDQIFDYMTPSECFRQMVEESGPDVFWYVDYSKKVWSDWKSTIPAPYEITDTTLSTIFNNFSISADYSQVRNKIYVQGGYEVSTDLTIIKVCTGQERTWSIEYYPHNVHDVTIDGVPKDIGQENVDADDGTYDIFYNYYEKTLKLAVLEPTPAVGVYLVFKIQYEIPITHSAKDDASIISLAAREGGDGVYEYIIRDTSINARMNADKVAKHDLEQHKLADIVGSVTTLTNGFDIGQAVTINVTDCQYNGIYTIAELTVNSLGNNNVEYVIGFEGKREL